MAKAAKLAHKKKIAPDAAVSKLVMITGKGHRVTKNVTGRADCGARMTGWRYGTIGDVTCWGCLTPEERDARTPEFEVPPGQFELDKVLAELEVERPWAEEEA